jgi:hypothetical protein
VRSANHEKSSLRNCLSSHATFSLLSPNTLLSTPISNTLTLCLSLTCQPMDTHTHTYLLTPWSRVLLEKLTGFQLVKKFPAFTEPESSLPQSSGPANSPYPEPARPTSHFLKIHLNIILPSTPGSPNWSISFRFPHQNPAHASPHNALYALYTLRFCRPIS